VKTISGKETRSFNPVQFGCEKVLPKREGNQSHDKLSVYVCLRVQPIYVFSFESLTHPLIERGSAVPSWAIYKTIDGEGLVNTHDVYHSAKSSSAT
jgi:hypothetical protein